MSCGYILTVSVAPVVEDDKEVLEAHEAARDRVTSPPGACSADKEGAGNHAITMVPITVGLEVVILLIPASRTIRVGGRVVE